MQNKKKFIIAIILFIFLGLTIYTFANPADDQIKEQGSGNGDEDIKFEEPSKEDTQGNNTNTNVSETIQTVVNDHGVRTDLITIVDNQGTDNNEGTNDEEDDTYAKALAAVILAESKLESVSYESALELVNSVTNNEQQTELNDRLTEVKNAIDVKELVATLYDKTNKAANKVEMDDARDFRTLEEVVDKVSSLSNATLKDELETTLEELSKLLDDNTPAGRVYSTIRESETMKVYDDGKNKNYYIKNGDSFVFAISYDEELKSNPIAVIGGREVELILNEKVKEEESKYLYEGKFEIGENESKLAEGLLEITIKNVIDMAFNEATDETAVNQTRTSNGRSVIYDITAPKFNFSNGKIASKFTVEVEDDNFDYMTVINMKTGKTETINTSVYELPNEGADNLRYDIIAYDRAGNQTKKVNIYIDNTNPVFDGNGIVGSKEEKLVNNGVYKKVTLNVTDGSLKKVVKVNGTEEEILAELNDNYNTAKVMSYEKAFEEEGTYTIKAIDRLGNEGVITFIVDKTKPVISNVENGKYYNTDVTPMVTDDNLKNVTLKLDGKHIKSYKVGDTLTEEGTYTIVATDKAMNKTNTVTFTIDKTNPEVTLYMKGKEVETGKWYTATLKAEIEETNEYTAILKDHTGKEVEYVSGSDITGRANYTLTVTDVAGNETVVEFGIDKDYPLIYLNGNKNEKVKEDVQYFNKDVEVKITDLNLDTVEFTKDSEEKTFENNTTITEEGTYVILATDKAGNQTKVTFVIDKTNPTISIDTNKSIGSDVYYSKVVINVSDNSNLDYYLINGRFKSTITNLTNTHSRTFVGGHIVEGKNTIVVYDKAGNVSEEIKFIADYTKPVVKSSDFYVSGKTAYGEKNNVYYATNGDKIVANVKTDEELGNNPTFTFSNNGVDVVVESTFRGVESHGYYEYSATLTIPGEFTDGEVTYTISGIADRAKNSADNVVKATNGRTVVVDKSIPEIEKVQIYNIDNIDSNYIKNGQMVRVLATFKEELSNLPTLKISEETVEFTKIAGGNGEAIYSAYLTIPENESKLNEGSLEFTISGYKDLAGNAGTDVTNESAKKNLTYDRTVPVITVKDDSVGTEGHYSRISLKLHDNFELSSAIVNGIEYKRGNNWNDLNFQNVNNYVEGENTIVLKDKAGNESTFTFVYDTTAPSYNFVGIMNIDQKTEGYAKVGDRVWVYVVANEHLSQEPTITINGAKAKIVQTEDGAKFNADWYKYVGEVVMTEEMAEGEIKFTINEYKDLAGNQGLELTNANINKGLESIKLDKTAPKITVRDSSVVLDEVYGKLNIQIFDANTVAKVVINGKELPHTGKYVDINDGHAYTFVDGENIVEVTDKAGNVTTQRFLVDKVAPTYKSMGILPASSTGTAYAKAGTKVTVNVQFTEELGVKPQLKVNGKEIDNAFNNGTQRGEVYIYTAYYTVTEEDSEGEIQLEVSRYADKLGNVGKTLTNENLNIGGQKKVVIDKTAPVISIDRKVELSVGDEFIEDIYSKISDNYTNVSDLKVEIYPVNGIIVDTNTAGTYQINYKISDKNGNYSVTTRTVIVQE